MVNHHVLENVAVQCSRGEQDASSSPGLAPCKQQDGRYPRFLIDFVDQR